MVAIGVARVLTVVLALATVAGPAEAQSSDDLTDPDSDLAAWRSPAAGPTLTEGEYLLLKPFRRQTLDPDGDGQQDELVVVPFETPSGEEGRSIAVLHPTPAGYRSEFLLNVLAEELQSVRLVRFGASRTPQIVVQEQATGSGGFLTLHVFGMRGGRMRRLLSAPGVYQGKLRLLPDRAVHPTRLALTRHIAGEIDAYPRGFWRENYRWAGNRLVMTSRRRVFFRNVPSLPDEPPPTLTSPTHHRNSPVGRTLRRLPLKRAKRFQTKD